MLWIRFILIWSRIRRSVSWNEDLFREIRGSDIESRKKAIFFNQKYNALNYNMIFCSRYIQDFLIHVYLNKQTWFLQQKIISKLLVDFYVNFPRFLATRISLIKWIQNTGILCICTWRTWASNPSAGWGPEQELAQPRFSSAARSSLKMILLLLPVFFHTINDWNDGWLREMRRPNPSKSLTMPVRGKKYCLLGPYGARQ